MLQSSRRVGAGQPAPKGKAPRDYTLAHAGRQFRIGPIAFWLTISTVTVMALWSAGTASYFAFRDDLLTRLIGRQAEMQYAYEDRITELRAQVDRLTSRQMLDQEQVEQKIDHLVRRQSTLEQRASALAGLPDSAPTGSIKPPAKPIPLRGDAAAMPSLKPSPISDTGPARPLTETERRAQLNRSTRPQNGKKPASTEIKLAQVELSLARVEARQNAALAAMEETYDAKIRRVRGVLMELGVDAGKASPTLVKNVGGPFIPASLRADGGNFEKALFRIQSARGQMERLNHTLLAVPVRKPVDGDMDTSSGFGMRLDPFVRAPALHSGLDFRGTTGDPVRATAAGTVVTAGWNGGYGKMVEIDHGNGLSTRYGHMSEIHVREDQAVRPGQIVGRIGSTGRSTGPHLHYETRVDGDAVDPNKFLRAGLRLGERS